MSLAPRCLANFLRCSPMVRAKVQNRVLVSISRHQHDRLLSTASPEDRNGSTDATATAAVAPPVTVTKTAAGGGEADETRTVKLDICGDIEGELQA